jgi:cell division protein ZipA
MTIYIITGVLVLALVAYLLFKPKPKSVLDDYYFTTQSQSNQRIKDLNLDTPSQDASHILDLKKLSFPDMPVEPENSEYTPNLYKDWVIDIISVNGDAIFNTEDLSKMFDYDWRSKFESTIYGFSPDENGWTFAFAGDSPARYTKLQVAIDLQRVFDTEKPNYDPKKLERYLVELEKRIKKFPVKLRLEHKESVESALQKAKQVVSIHQEFNRDAILVLQSDKPFRGMEMWDALQSVGLTWGDGDLFHWMNENDYGDDQLFSVWTTTEPGYFLPEDIKEGNMNPENLVFGFSIARCADPENVFDAMVNAAEYCQKRLGGEILDGNMQPFQREQERKNLSEFIKQMEEKGLKPGSDNALQTF